MLWGTDDFAAAGELMGLSSAWLHRREDDQLRKATTVIAITEPLAERWRSMGYSVEVIGNGVDAGHFVDCDEAEIPEDVTLTSPVATFVGHLSDRIDLSCLEEVAKSGSSLLLVGPRQATFELQRLDALLALPNVQWVGPKGFDRLPSYLRLTQVGITPYVDSTFNRSSFPLKTLEYLAAGRPVVITNLPSARALDTDLITIATSPEDFAARTVALLRAPYDPEFAAAAQSFAFRHDWSSRTKDIARTLGLKSAESPAS